MTRTRTHAQSRSSDFIPTGFTLVELMVVVVLMGVVSMTVIPAMNNINLMREGAARDDLVRMIEIAKGRALASGTPHGVSIDLNSSSITLVRITQAGEVEAQIDPLTNRASTINIPSQYSGVSIISLEQGNDDGEQDIIWFDYESNPHVRDDDGGFLALNDQKIIITLSSGASVLVYPHSGVLGVE